jgi:hypothetical protein
MWRSGNLNWESATPVNTQQRKINFSNDKSFSQWGSVVQVPSSHLQFSQKESSGLSSNGLFLGNDSSEFGLSSPSSSSIGLRLGALSSSSSSSFDFDSSARHPRKSEVGIFLGERERERENSSMSLGRTSRDENSSFFMDDSDDNISLLDSSSINDELTTVGGETFTYRRPVIPQSAEEVSEVILDKLEQAGRVPSKEKFRRMACNVS